MSLVRLGIRVRADRAESALAALLPVLRDGAEERVLDGDVEYATYGAAAKLPATGAIRALAGDAVVAVTREPVPDGWETRWHEHLEPVRVGPLTIRPPWLDGDRDDLVIDPGTCFGAGGHPTTRLCLELLLAADPGGPLCDWGAGTGVLAIAAARRGWAPVQAVDADPVAVELIGANAARNGVAVAARRLDLAAVPAPPAATVVANLPFPLHLAAAAATERPPATLIAAGMLREEADAVVAAYGLRAVERRQDGDWGAVLAR